VGKTKSFSKSQVKV